MAPDQKAFTVEFVKQIQDINGNPAYTEEEKKVAIANLKKVSKKT